jgi:hypothetical protein
MIRCSDCPRLLVVGTLVIGDPCDGGSRLGSSHHGASAPTHVFSFPSFAFLFPLNLVAGCAGCLIHAQIL